jgi:hypothetical protein
MSTRCVGVCCARMDSALRTCHGVVKSIPLPAAMWMRASARGGEGLRVFTRALRKADGHRMDA